MVLEIRKGIEVRKVEAGKEGMVEVIVETNKEKWRLVGVYINGDMEKKLECMKEWTEEGDGVRTLIGGDFNARTGEDGGGVDEQNWEEEGGRRRSKDKKMNKEGRVLVGRIEEVGWAIFNGNIEGDRQGEWTFTEGRGESVIDYVVGSVETKEMVNRMEIRDCVDSDPLVVWIGGNEGNQFERGGGSTRRRWVWLEKGIEDFREALGELPVGDGEVERVWEEMKELVLEILKRGNKEKGGIVRRGWWDEECRIKKKEVRRALRRWREGEGDRQWYKKERLEYRKLMERKKKEENEKWEKELREIKTENQVWEMVGKTRGRKRVNEGIKMEEWNKYFRDLLGGVNGRVRRGAERGRGGDQEEGLTREEIKRVLSGMKDKKAAGADGIPAEVWKYGGEKMERWV
ncbi:uncharacterized protein LOC120359229 [Solenopsis invicta]|uniref:uncharacterized protein LOC120359229 n=1 Tax=Solenopsis invicta TaxID=13686 RepID=UPI00193D6EF1|nr:uncharacterized protein LOC120359229 [Solenopsis invicta]